MKNIIDIEKARLEMMVKRGYRNWASQFGENFDAATCLRHISFKTLTFLAQGGEKNSFYLYDLIMNLLSLGSGFEFNELHSKQKMVVVDRYLFLLDRIRFEYMKRLGWLESYPGQEIPLVDLVVQFEALAPGLQTKTPLLSREHTSYDKFSKMGAFEREELIRRLIPEALREIQDKGDSAT